jgi:hypothetical protein
MPNGPSTPDGGSKPTVDIQGVGATSMGMPGTPSAPSAPSGPDVSGAANISTTSTQSSGTNFDVGGVPSTTSAEVMVDNAQANGPSTNSAGYSGDGEAVVDRGLGVTGGAVIAGGGVGIVENGVGVDSAETAATGAGQNAVMNEQIGVDGGSASAAGVQSTVADPTSAATGEASSQADFMVADRAGGTAGDVDLTVGRADQAQQTYVDPEGSAVSGATTSADSEVSSVSGVDPVSATGAANTASQATQDPTAAAREEGESQVADRSGTNQAGVTDDDDDKKS